MTSFTMSTAFRAVCLTFVVAASLLSAGVASAQTFDTLCYNYTRDLTIGSTGADVVALQTVLVARGHLVIPAGAAMGYFGPLTQAAVAQFQTTNGVIESTDIPNSVGYFGPVTREKLNDLYDCSTTTPSVPGCAPGDAFSSLTGQSCGITTIPGCGPGALYSSLTGQSCTSSAPRIVSTSAMAAGNFEMDAGGQATISGTNLNSAPLTNGPGSPPRVYFGNIEANVTYASNALLNILVPSSLVPGQNYGLYVSNDKGTSNVVSVRILSVLTTVPGCLSGALFNSLTGQPCLVVNTIPSIITTTLPNGAVGIDYQTTGASITSTGGIGTRSWTVSAGTLPPGVSLNYTVCPAVYPSDCTSPETIGLYGTPTTGGTYTFTVTVTVGSQSASKQLSITVNPAGTPTPTITVTSPNGGETWTQSTMQTIRWNSTGVSGVEIFAEQAVSPYTQYRILGAVTNTGSFSWSVGSVFGEDLAPGNYKIRVQQTNDGVSDTSNSAFTITDSNSTAPETDLSIRNLRMGETSVAFEVCNNGTATQVAYETRVTANGVTSSMNTPAANVAPGTCAPHGVGDHGYSRWNMQPGSSYTVTASVDPRNQITESNEQNNSVTVSVVVPSIQPLVTLAPRTGETLAQGQQYQIRWSDPRGTTGRTYAINLMTAENKYVARIADAATGGVFPWTVTTPGNAGGTYKIYVGEIGDGPRPSTWGEPFTISGTDLSIKNLRMGETSVAFEVCNNGTATQVAYETQVTANGVTSSMNTPAANVAPGTCAPHGVGDHGYSRWNMQPGSSYTVTASVDPRNQITESNEQNNSVSSVITAPVAGGVLGASAPTQSSETTCNAFSANLSMGASGSAVEALQQALVKDGETVEVTGYFGSQTAAAVKAFQEKYAAEVLTPNGLTAGTGFVGAATRAKLNQLFGCDA